MNFLKNFKILLSVLIFATAVGALYMMIYNKVQDAQTLNQNDNQLMRQLLLLLESQKTITGISAAGKAILLKQSLENVLETGNLSYFFPIPLNERKRTVIFSSWRSGSTFIGDIFKNLPTNYYDFEPFNYLGVTQVKTDNESIAHVKDLLSCKYRTKSTLEHMHDPIHWAFDTHMRVYCVEHEKGTLCHNVAFREAFCNIFPRQNMKLVRARITLAEALLSDPNLNVNVVLQVRDPRAVFVSRKRLENCHLSPDCSSMGHYCKYLVEDYKAAKILLEKYPKNFKVLRFEDLALNPYEETNDMFDQFGIEFDKNIENFLDEHTKSTRGTKFNTFRNSRAVVSTWMHKLNIVKIKEIQANCMEAMKLWGYRLMNDLKQVNLTEFNPVGDFSI